MNLAILIPVYNEAEYLPELFKKLKPIQKNYNILFVDDGSEDDSLSMLYMGEQLFMDYYPNKGKGYAVKLGANNLINKGYDYILVMDSDLQNSVNDIPIFIQAAKQYPQAKIILGNRLHKPSGMPFIRLVTNKVMSWIISKMAGQKIPDTQCGFRLIHKDVLKIPTKEERFGYESEMLIKAGREGYSIKSVPIKCIYHKGRRSKINPIKDTIRWLKVIWKFIYE